MKISQQIDKKECELLSKVGRILLKEKDRRDIMHVQEERAPLLIPKRKANIPF